MKVRYWYAIGFAVIIVICLSAFVLAPGAEFGGADGQGESQIQEIDPEYTPWFESLWSPPAETESMLFALQAAIGALIIAFFIGNERGKRVARRKDSEKEASPVGKAGAVTDKDAHDL